MMRIIVLKLLGVLALMLIIYLVVDEQQSCKNSAQYARYGYCSAYELRKHKGKRR